MILKQDTYVKEAENVIQSLAQNKDQRGNPKMITTSQIRNLLAMTADIYNEVQMTMGDELTEQVRGRINYLKIRFVYEAGRDTRLMKSFVEKAKILQCIDEIKCKSDFILFNHYMEALVAYHKFYGGKD